MVSNKEHNSAPAVSIILPTYNRAHFLCEAFESIRSQQFRDWELIIVDDGSTDDTAELVASQARDLAQPVRYVVQPNHGPYGARNTGLDVARGRYLAFFDSDDLWLPHHLAHCVEVLDANTDVDWVFGATRIVNMASGHVKVDNTFYRRGQPRPFMQLRARSAEKARIIDDPSAIQCGILDGFCAGLQCSLFRRRMFEPFRFEAVSRNEAEDQLLLIHALTAGRRIAYLNDVHLIYRIHENNSSASTHSTCADKHARVFLAMIAGLEQLGTQVPLTASQKRALRRRLAQECFWHLGYALFWRNGQLPEALAAFRRGLRHWPWDWRLWKTYLTTRLRVALMPSACPGGAPTHQS
jgi:glycosyltransferase involved in cell wall biosynthesis